MKLYVGPMDADGRKTISLAGQDFRDANKWEVWSEPLGFVDFENDRIAVFDGQSAERRVPSGWAWRCPR